MRESMQDNRKAAHCSTSEMIKYALGACTESLVLNSFFGYSMLYYTKALGLAPEIAGLTTFIATIWGAVADPVMGHISDNTKSRFGKRYPYILAGGVVMIVSFFFIWYVPVFFQTDKVLGAITIPAMTMLFGYLVVMNLILRTGYTVFIVPYTALGFEICSDYEGRSKIQGIRNAMNMAANLLGPALAWTIYFNNNTGPVQDTQIAQNYINMGFSFTLAAFIFLGLMLVFMVRYIKDSRCDQIHCSPPASFFRNIREILQDAYARWVFAFIFVVMLGIVLVSTLQMYVFDDYMKMGGIQKTIAHGGTMVGMGLGSLSLGFFVRRFDKKGAIYIAVAGSVLCELILAGIFLTGFIPINLEMRGVPVAFAIFVFFHSAYWFGNGILIPTATSMMADISEINEIKTDVNKNASYAAMFSLITKVSMGIGGLAAGYGLGWIGFQMGDNAVQLPQFAWSVSVLTFVAGPMISLIAMVFIMKYKATQMSIDSFRSKSK